jgi:pimeloyl-ACP methyl ester carboxylesterase
MSDRLTVDDRFRTAQARLLVAAEARAVSRMVRVQSAWTHLLEAGSGRPVVLLHGGGAGAAASFVPLIAQLQDGFRLLAPDRPGCGLTDRRSYRNVRVREHAGHFVEALLDSLGLGRVNLVGSSMGGYWALAFTLTHPERVQRLVLLGAQAGAAHRPPLRQRLLVTPGLGGLLHAAGRTDRAGLAARLVRRYAARPERLSDPLLDMIHAGEQMPGARRAARSLLQASVSPVGSSRLTYALRDELGAVKLPVLLVWGDRDPCSTRWGRELCEHMPNARLEVVPEAGHLVWLDDPEATARAMRDFMDVSGVLSVRRGQAGGGHAPSA